MDKRVRIRPRPASNGVKTIESNLQVKESKLGVGKGLFTAAPLTRGMFVAEYTGAKISSEEANRLSSRYLFELNADWTIDGSSESNIARYINHSCDPNTEAEIIDERIVVYASKDIPKGSELTLDYGQEYFDEFIRPTGCKCTSGKHR